MVKKSKQTNDAQFSARNLTLHNLRLVKSESNLGDLRKDELPGFAVQNIALDVGNHSETKPCVVQAEFSIRVYYEEQETDDEEPAILVKAHYELVYTIVGERGAIHTEQDELTNAIHEIAAQNAWPYWREFVQSQTVRMGLPAFPMPILNPDIDNHKTKTVQSKAQGPKR